MIGNGDEHVSGTITLPGQDALIGSWEALTGHSLDARVLRTDSTLIAVFPSWTPLNNALLLADPGQSTAEDAAKDAWIAFRRVGVNAWALWIPDRRADLDGPGAVTSIRGMVRDTTTLVMTRTLSGGLPSHPGVRRTTIDAATLATDEPVPVEQLPHVGERRDLEGWVLVQAGHAVAGAWAYRHTRECGLYAVGTVAGWRRQGLAAALVRHILADAHRRGARTASLQSTRMGRQLYASLGFTAVGRYEEWIPTITEKAEAAQGARLPMTGSRTTSLPPAIEAPT